MSRRMMSGAREQIQTLLEGAERVLIVAHIEPDGDAIGSALGLAWALRRRGTLCTVACADEVPASLRFLPGSEEFVARWRVDEDVMVVVDTSDTARIGAIYPEDARHEVPLVVIDHHTTNLRYGDVNWVEERAATCQLVLELVTTMGIPLDDVIATCLLTGLITDTRGFRTRSTDAHALQTAVTLVNAGASLGDIMDAVFRSRSSTMLRVWGLALSDVHLEDGVIWVSVSQEDLERVGAAPSATEGLSNLLSTVRDAEVAVVFRELRPGVVDVSLRSAPRVDVAAVALSLGGGGHRQAAGCLLEASLPEAQALVLNALRQSMTEKTTAAGGGTRRGVDDAGHSGA
ncbi:MAG TPA: bifunctional oligoribonuclease/PAP phosphatase NrnA [Chloroflexi bacterium]|nr:bifunctional oligoribonuclease/PAP phosphatase NrnA [Chloroflexota bacterium]